MGIMERQLGTILSRSWWVLLLRGLVAIAFGALAWLLPEVTVATMVLLFGTYSIVDGILGVWSAIAGRGEHDDWWVLLVWGLIGIGVGVLTLLVPRITALVLLFYIAAWAIATGVLEILAAIRIRKEIKGEWRLILGGLASVVFGVLLMAQPQAGLRALTWLIAIYASVFGLLLVILAFRVRSFGRELTSQ